MSALPQCDAFGYIYDQAGDPAPDVLVTLKKVIDASGNSILLSPLTTLTDPAGSFHFTLPEDAAATISARASGLWNCPDGRTFKVPPGPSGELIATFLLPGSSSVVPPLIYVSDTLSLPRSSPSADGYLSAADYVRFDAATDITGGVSSFAARTGDITPLVGDYQAFYLRLSGGALTGPLTLASDPTMPMQAATMQYVLNQLASATAGVASFNSRTGVVVPLAPDYASFYAPVTHAHTRSQITDLGVFSTSQPGLVPQPTSGDAAKVLTGAGTWVDQASGGGGTGTLPAGEYLATDFKASGSPTKFTGTISSGSTTLTLSGTPAPDFQVGQGIYIAAGGSGGTSPLVTKVTAISGTTITLQTAALATVTAVANNVQHDDTAAIQAGIDYIFANNGGTLLMTPGLYRLNGPLSSIGSLLTLPYRDITTTVNLPISIRGTVPLSAPGFFGLTTTLGAVFQTDVQNTAGAMIRAATYVAGSGGVMLINNVSVWLENLTWRTYPNPQISAVDLGMAQNVFLKQLTIDANADMGTAPEPTAATTFGLRCPRDTSSSTGHVVDIVYVQNYYTGLIFAEQLVCNKAYAMRCKVGVEFGFSYHQCIGHAVLYHCPTSVYYRDRCVTQFCFDFEKKTASSDWDSPVAGHDLFDPGNLATGFTTYVAITTDSVPSGAIGPVSVTGLTKMIIFDLAGQGAIIPKLNVPTELDVDGLEVTNSLTVKGAFSLSDGLMVEPVSFGATDSADTGFRHVRIPNASAATLVTGLVSYWKHNETSGASNDVVGGNHLSMIGTITTEPGKTGFGNCRVAGAGGLSGALSIPDNSSLDFSANKSITINGWFNIVDLTHPFELPCLLGKWAGTGANDFLLIYNGISHAWQFSVTADGTFRDIRLPLVSPRTTEADATIPATPTLNTWYMLTAIFDFSLGHISLQVNNGTPVTSPFLGPIFHGSAAMMSFEFSGLGSTARIDEVGLWQRALTSTEVNTLWAGGAGLTYPF
jgi:hypothetical protein